MRRPAILVRNLAVHIPELPEWLDGLRIAHVSDLHFCGWNQVTRAAQNQLCQLSYDLLVATGDFADTPAKWRQAADMTRAFFKPIASRAPVYAVLGNHDDPRIATVPEMPLIFLRNQSVKVDFAGSGFELAGVEQSLFGGEDLPVTLGPGPTGGIVILLAHYPSTVLRIPPGRVQLVLAGHTHGGQIRLPGLGCIWTNDRISPRMSRGLHRVGATFLHVSAGVGVSALIRARLNCPPEISLLTLRPSHILAKC